MQKRKTFCLLSLGINDSFFKKDIGIIPYLMQKLFSYRALYVTFKTQGGNTFFPSLSLFTENVDFDYIELSSKESLSDSLLNYIIKNAAGIDVLFIVGFYDCYFKAVETYKMLNCRGIVYCKLDANRYWVNSKELDEAFTFFLKNCDIITSESMIEYLNKKWPVPVHYIPNGFYDFDPDEDHLLTVYPYGEKKNIIFTAGRLGSPEKATDHLLEAFRLAHREIPGWKLCLAGDIEKNFIPYIQQFMHENPSLTDRSHIYGTCKRTRPAL